MAGSPLRAEGRTGRREAGRKGGRAEGRTGGGQERRTGRRGGKGGPADRRADGEAGWVRLPGLEVDWIKAKLDTVARSSAIHAFDIMEIERDEQAWVRFGIHPWQHSFEESVDVELPVHDRRSVRSSSGHVQERYVVLMDLTLLDRTVTAEVTLTSRDQMGFRMLIGREALRQGYLIDSRRSYLGDRLEKSVRRRNRGA